MNAANTGSSAAMTISPLRPSSTNRAYAGKSGRPHPVDRSQGLQGIPRLCRPIWRGDRAGRAGWIRSRRRDGFPCPACPGRRRVVVGLAAPPRTSSKPGELGAGPKRGDATVARRFNAVRPVAAAGRLDVVSLARREPDAHNCCSRPVREMRMIGIPRRDPNRTRTTALSKSPALAATRVGDELSLD